MPVHLCGRRADMPALASLAESYGLEIVEDACQAHGAGRATPARSAGGRRGISGRRETQGLSSRAMSNSAAACGRSGSAGGGGSALTTSSAGPRGSTPSTPLCFCASSHLDKSNASDVPSPTSTRRAWRGSATSRCRIRATVGRSGTSSSFAPVAPRISPLISPIAIPAAVGTIRSRCISLRSTLASASSQGRSGSPSRPRRNAFRLSIFRGITEAPVERSSGAFAAGSSVADGPQRRAVSHPEQSPTSATRSLSRRSRTSTGAAVGDNTRIGLFVEVQRGAIISSNCKIQSHLFICDGVTIEDQVIVRARCDVHQRQGPACDDARGRCKWRRTRGASALLSSAVRRSVRAPSCSRFPRRRRGGGNARRGIRGARSRRASSNALELSESTGRTRASSVPRTM